MNNWLQDIRYSVRMLRKTPMVTLLVIVALALGIGANTAMFSAIDAVLLRPLPFYQSDQLVDLRETEAAPGDFPITYPDWQDWRAQNHVFTDITIYSWEQDINVGGKGEPDRVAGIATSANFFTVLGVPPSLGRAFANGEDQLGHNKVAVLSYPLWQNHFGGDREIVGRTVDLNNEPFTVVGVMPPTFHFPGEAALWIPLVLKENWQHNRGTHWLRGFARLRTGVSLATARAEMQAISIRLEKQYPEQNHKVHAIVLPLHERLVQEARPRLLLLLGAVALVLLIACVNVANLLLSRALSRIREMALRAALGAGRQRLVRQLLTESVLLGVLGGAAGLLLANAAVAFLKSKSFNLHSPNPMALDARVLVFTLGLAVLTGILFGLAPALQLSRPDVYDELRASGSGTGAVRTRRGLSDALVIAEVAISLTLLISAGLLLKSFHHLRATAVGVRAEGVLTFRISFPEERYKTVSDMARFTSQLLPRLSSLPGVDAAGVTSKLPLEGGSNGFIHVEGKPYTPMSGPLVEISYISGDYFRAMGIPLLKGRLFTPQDEQATLAFSQRAREITDWQHPPDWVKTVDLPVIVNAAMAKLFWTNQDPLGKRFSDAENGPWWHIVGVVGDVKQYTPSEPVAPERYQADTSGNMFVVHSVRPNLALANAVRDQVQQIDRSLPLYSIRTMQQVIDNSTIDARLQSSLVGCFAALALLLAVVGIYGVMSYLVSQRTREIGVRVALGADRVDVVRMIIRHGLRLTLVGLVIAIAGAAAAGHVLSGFLYMVNSTDPLVYGLMSVMLAAVALLACYIPARRAAGVDPMTALRYE